MNRLALIKKYQSYNPITGQFDQSRTNRDYANLLGIHESYLSKAYAGLHPIGMKALVGLMRAFPAAVNEMAQAMLAEMA